MQGIAPEGVEIADGVSDLEGDPVIVSELAPRDVGGHRVLPVARWQPVEEVAALIHLMALQLHAFHLALARGQAPDRVRYFAVNMRLIGQGKTTQDADLWVVSCDMDPASQLRGFSHSWIRAS